MASSAWHSRQAEIGLKALCSLPLTAEAGTEHPIKRQLHTAHVEAVDWKPHGSSNATCTEKVILNRIPERYQDTVLCGHALNFFDT